MSNKGAKRQPAKQSERIRDPVQAMESVDFVRMRDKRRAARKRALSSRRKNRA